MLEQVVIAAMGVVMSLLGGWVYTMGNRLSTAESQIQAIKYEVSLRDSAQAERERSLKELLETKFDALQNSMDFRLSRIERALNGYVTGH